jgi:glycosyltransferase involved in cell wall biosynthesis
MAQLVAPNDMAVRELKTQHDLEAWKLPVPVDTDRLAFRERQRADVFMSVYGYGGLKDRRSIPEIFAAWAGIKDPPVLLLRAQKKPDELELLPTPHNVHVEVGNTQEPSGLYEVGDIALQPSRYEGVGVSMLEAQSCGMPVIATDAEPMTEIAPDLLVPVQKRTYIAQMGKALFSHIPSIPGIADRVRSLHKKDIRELSQNARKRVEEHFSWKTLRGRWIDALEGRRP